MYVYIYLVSALIHLKFSYLLRVNSTKIKKICGLKELQLYVMCILQDEILENIKMPFHTH